MAGGPWLYATSGTGNLGAVLATLFRDIPVLQIQRATPLPQLLPVRPGTGKNISWVIPYTNGSGYTNGGVADGADVSVYNSDTKTYAYLEYCSYMEAVSVGGRAQAAAAAAGNPAAFANLMAYEVREASRRRAVKIATDFYTGTGASNQLQGLYSTTGSTYGALQSSGTYAGVSRSTVTEWASNVESNSSVDRPLTLELMRNMRRKIYVACGEKPNLIVTDPIQFQKYSELLTPYRQFKQDVTLRGQKIVLDGGFSVLDFDGIPVVEDPNHPAGKMSWFNTNYTYISQLPYSPEMAAGGGDIALAGTFEEQFGEGAMKLSAKLIPLAQTGDAKKVELMTYCQIVVERPNACGHIADLAS